MTCLEIQGQITPFINGELTLKELEVFLEHINHCEDCKEELEVYYTLLSGMRQLDEDKHLSSDFHHDFLMELRHAEEKIHYNRRKVLSKQIILIVTICLIAIFSSYGIGGYVVEEIINTSNKPQTSNFIIKNYFFRNRSTAINQYIEENNIRLAIYRINIEQENSKDIFLISTMIESQILQQNPILQEKIMIPK